MNTPQFPAWLPMQLIIGLALGAIVIVAIWIAVGSFARSKDGNIKKQLNVGVAGLIPIAFLFLIIGGAAFAVASWAANDLVVK